MSVRACTPRVQGNPRTGTFFMLCLIPYFVGDKNQAVRLAEWIRDLGGVKNHSCLLVIDSGTDSSGVIEPLREAFGSVNTINSPSAGPQGTWGDGTTDATAPNEMWMTGANCVYHKQKVPFFWLEPDAVPLRSTWLDEIEAEYKGCGKKFMGMLVNSPPHELHMSGVAVYPADVANHSLAMMMPGPVAWDYAGRDDTVRRQKAHFTKLIQHEYRVHGKEPTFPDRESLSIIKPETAVFHRCKVSDLVDRLREQKLTLGTESEAQQTSENNILEKLKSHSIGVRKLIAGNKSREKYFMGQLSSVVSDKQQAMRDRMAKARAARKPRK